MKNVGKDTIVTTDQKEKENRNDSGHDNRRVYSTDMLAEALVNPAMITHPNPKRVAIIGDKVGAPLREVLKHRSVEEVVILATDEEELKVGSENDCATIKAACAPSCSMDSKASLIVEDPHKWMIDSNTKVDVFIMNYANMNAAGDQINNLYGNDQFATSLLNKLSDDGVFAVDFSEFDGDGKYALDIDQVRDNVLVTLKRAGFKSMHTYEEAHVQFLVSFKDYESRANWYMASSEISIELHKRIYKGTQSREPSFLLFDAPTMVRYQVPPKDHETMYCDQDEEPWECDEYAGIDPETLSIPLSHLTAKKEWRRGVCWKRSLCSRGYTRRFDL
jgi:spermidine synthase